MKLAALLICFLISSTASGTTYEYPKERIPEVSLVEACDMAATMLKSQSEAALYHGYHASLWGSADPRDGGWHVWFSDKDGNVVIARIPLRGDSCTLSFLPKQEKGRDVKFRREGTKVIITANEAKAAK
jgi:hypothetical protein